MASSDDYRKAYESAKRQLAELLAAEENMQKKKLQLRKTIETLAALCESEGIAIDPSPEAASLLEHSTLADDVRGIMRAFAPDYLRPHEIMRHVERIGRDISVYTNPQATVQMILKRMEESLDVEMKLDSEGKKTYRYLGHLEKRKVRFESTPVPGAGPATVSFRRYGK